ncbi:D-alanine--D-alanine ligase family protein [Pseudomonas sp. NPDC089407]|uniref:D-alanine--D-alanine ligase family protein n=1 Tax=Pseudomonas sp. NPDC089407 TaxID=3364464 RepID=UPI003850D256
MVFVTSLSAIGRCYSCWILDTVAKIRSSEAAKMKQIVIALIFGGRSTEHFVSLRSAAAIHAALMALGHRVHCIGIERNGTWRYQGQPGAFPGEVNCAAPIVSLRPGGCSLTYALNGQRSGEVEIDLLFPALHGRWGEDGTLQGLAAMCGIPCVGTGVLGSAVSMDKDITKRLLSYSGIAVSPWIAMRTMRSWDEVVECLGSTTLFVKPATSGSSIGVSRVTNESEYVQAYTDAARIDSKVLIEAEISAREVECGVLESRSGLLASALGEIVPKTGQRFYDYQAKYGLTGTVDICVPCQLPPAIANSIQKSSKKVFRILELSGYARIDFFLKSDGTILLNEVNTLPGFTKTSMYPKMLECSGFSLPRLVGELVDRALLWSASDQL